MYIGTAFMLGQVAEHRGETREAERMRNVAVDLAAGTRTLDFFVPPAQQTVPAETGDAPPQRTIPVRP
jgi:hypothetical protein